MRFSKGTTVVAEVAVPALAVDATRSVTATWMVPVDNTEPTAHFMVAVDPGHAIAETAETNNVLDHPVPLWLRPTGKDVVLWPLDETYDESHALQGWDVDHYQATLSGTASETGAPLTLGVTVNDSTRPMRAFANVPPGVYTLTHSALGLAPATPSFTVTVTRNPANPYEITYTPEMPVELWYNTWGDLSGTVLNGAVPIGGAKVVLTGPAERSATATDGTFAFAKLPAGTYSLQVTADGYQPIRQFGTSVLVGHTTPLSIPMVATTFAYFDVTVTDDQGGPISGATAQLRETNDFARDTATTDANGVAHLSYVAGVDYYVNVSAPWYVSAKSNTIVAPVAGQIYPIGKQLELDTSSIERASCDYSKWCISSDFYSIGGNDWYGFYRCFATRFGVGYVDDGGDRKVQMMDADVKAWPFMVTLLTVPVDWEIVEGGPFGFGSFPIPWSSPDRSNVKVEAVELFDATDGSKLWPASSQGLWYSHDGAGDEARKTFTMPAGGVTVPDWTKLEVRMWVTVQKVGGSTPPYWDPSPLGDSDGKAMIIYRPSDGSQRITPWLFDP